MGSGLLAGILWGLDTVILGVALASTPFVSTTQALFLAPFVSTFLHDFFSSIWLLLYMGFKKELYLVKKALKTKSGKFIMLGALLGGPIGMSGYVSAIKYIGPGYTAVISALYPALGTLFSYVFLKHRMTKVQLGGLAVSIMAVIGLSYVPNGDTPKNLFIGILCALLCVCGWSSEAVICAYGMQHPDVNEEQALQIRQATSALIYGGILLPILSGWKFTISIVPTWTFGIVALAALFGTTSYVMYYRAIQKIGPPKAMALNITYSAWSMVFSAIFLHTLPDIKSVVCGIILICGSLVAANGLPSFAKMHKKS